MAHIPAWLKKGDKVAFTAPAGRVEKGSIEEAAHLIESWGLVPLIGSTIGKSHFKFSSTDEARLQEIQGYLDDDTVRAIWCARGGYGTIRLLEKLNPAGIKKNPKWVIGLSDITHLHAWLNHTLNIASIHGFMPVAMGKKDIESSVQSLRDLLFGRKKDYQQKTHARSIQGMAEGTLIGGNLSILYSMIGTPWDFNPEGKILFIEEVSEHHYHIDRMVHSLKYAGRFDALKGLIVGGFTDMEDSPDEFGMDVKSIILNAVATYDIPVWFDFPAGHAQPNLALPFGVNAKMEVGEKESRLEFLF
ncbi:MAG: S66 peptidase family protein [Bacteroidota bacterium]